MVWKIFNKDRIKKSASALKVQISVEALTSNLFGGNFSNATLSSKNKLVNLRTILNCFCAK